MRGWFAPLVRLLVILFHSLQSTNGTDTIFQGQTITNPKTIISSNGKFELGFFSPGKTSNYYLGIWQKVSKPAIVWVANREYPFLSSSSNLTINSEGKLEISDGKMSYKVTNITISNNSNTFATLLDSGNLVLQLRSSLEVLWQSFDYPTDTLLPGMNLGYDEVYENTWSLVSWRSLEDPAPGSFSLSLGYMSSTVYVDFDVNLTVWQGSKTYWNGSFLEFENYGIYKNGRFYVTWGAPDTSRIMQMVLDAFGQLKIQSWSEDDQSSNSIGTTD
ncbi:G-type lectin S-receptor-like serine/threonine-protein kinase At2g19130 [Durio zibethinus]|uniref:G-type lectin S-receptor-like serine/threonine-protein kinase At2g19130 n=1 Tax=Durio zibethinus TaxID=66656 RepID=A0A6P5WNJ4_DURZI|nr:G-type lectin S-receptor-like serine/threonine-protein kinase At2g19130 [Durio zibethinus]